MSAMTRTRAAEDGLPVVALGGSKSGLGAKVGEMVNLVALDVEPHTLAGSGHFIPEEQPDAVVRPILAMAAKTRRPPPERRMQT